MARTSHMEKLFENFPPIDYETWINQLKKELKTDHVETVIRPLIDQIKTNAYLRPDSNVMRLAIPSKNQEEIPAYANANDWKICFDIHADDPLKTNKEILHHFEHGADAVRFNGDQISNQEELRLLLRNVLTDAVGLHFNCGEANTAIALMLTEELSGLKGHKTEGSLQYDFLADYAFRGKLIYSLKDSFQVLKHISSRFDDALPLFKTIPINACSFHNAGANAAQELAISLSLGAEYATFFQSENLLSSFDKNAFVRLAVDSSYFINIAKLRALRLLWGKMRSAFNQKYENSIIIHTETSLRNKSSYDIHNNLLRITVESLAAAAGGTDLHICHPHDKGFKAYSRASTRYGLNIQHLLKHESHIDKVLDPSRGAYYIEHLTAQIMEDAWKIFLGIEQQGGYVNAVKNGFIFSAISETAKIKAEEFKRSETIIVGLNKYTGVSTFEDHEVIPELTDKAQDEDFPCLKPLQIINEFETLLSQSASKGFKALIVSFGDEKMSKLRQEFTMQVYNTAGVESHQLPYNQCLSLDEIKKHGKHYHFVTFCGSDADYDLLNVNDLKKSNLNIILAGNCKNKDLQSILKARIYKGMDMFEFIKKLF